MVVRESRRRAVVQPAKKRTSWFAILALIVEYAIKIVAIGTIPENRKTGSSFAWLMLILFMPVVGLPLFLLIGSPWVRGRRHRIQGRVNEFITSRARTHPAAEKYTRDVEGADTIIALNRRLASLPIVLGRNEGLHGDYAESIRAMAAAIDGARIAVHVENYIMAWDDTTDVFFTACADAVTRGVPVRLLFDHLGTLGYPGYFAFTKRMTEAGIQWHPMMPIDPLRGRWRRPDLRNHRKLVVVDGVLAFMGSQNIIESEYLKRKNHRIGRHWLDLNIEVTGPIVDSLGAIFAIDWFTETGEKLDFESHDPAQDRTDERADDAADDAPDEGPAVDGRQGAFQLVASGPGFPTEPNLRLFVSLMHRAQRSLIIASPYFIPDESLLAAITTAAYRGVDVQLFVSEQGDHFMERHAQRSYYSMLLDAGVKIYLYPQPTVLHAKHFTVDGEIAVIGSSNMDRRSFALDYEIVLLAFGAHLAEDLAHVQDDYRAVSRRLTLEDWEAEPWYRRYVDNVMRLTSDVQ